MRSDGQLAVARPDIVYTAHVVGLRDRALISVMVYAFARVSAVVSLKMEDYFPLQKRWWLCLKEKGGGKVNEMGCHPKLSLSQYLDEYIAAAGNRPGYLRVNQPASRSAKCQVRRFSLGRFRWRSAPI